MSRSASDEPAPGPLAGVLVVELATVVMGPYAAQILGDLGAEVVKVEDRRGDSSRSMGGGTHPEMHGVAINLHRNKRSIELDLKHPAGREILDTLLHRADVFISNMRPAALRRLDLGYDQLADRHPQLLYCEAHGFALESGEADRPAYDDIIQAETGLPRLNEHVAGAVSFLPVILGDKLSALTVAYAVLAALYRRAQTGAGGHVEVPMFDTVLAFNLVEHLSGAAWPGTGGQAGYSRILTAHRGPHRTADGYAAVLPYSDANWQALYAAVGRADELRAPCFADHVTRLVHADEVYASLATVVREKTTAEWLELCARIGVPAAPVPTMDEVLESPASHRGVVRDAEHPRLGPYRQIQSPIRFDGQRAAVRRHAPLRGENTVEVLTELGYDADAVDTLLAAGAAVQHT